MDNPTTNLKRKRGPRALIACETCRRRKLRCDQASPSCSHCVRLQQPCRYRSHSVQLPRTQTPSTTPQNGNFTIRYDVFPSYSFLMRFIVQFSIPYWCYITRFTCINANIPRVILQHRDGRISLGFAESNCPVISMSSLTDST